MRLESGDHGTVVDVRYHINVKEFSGKISQVAILPINILQGKFLIFPPLPACGPHLNVLMIVAIRKSARE